ncbi:MAG: twin-arginine translocase TatA/TatE family subunit [Candidatus Sulfotelmatobacter sp.]
MGEFSIWHWLLVIVIAFLLFGTNKLGEVGKGLAEGIRNFKAGMRDPEPEKKEPAKEEKKEEAEVKKS